MIIAVIALLAILVLSTCWFTVNDKQQAVITTFGKVTGTADAASTSSCRSVFKKCSSSTSTYITKSSSDTDLTQPRWAIIKP